MHPHVMKHVTDKMCEHISMARLPDFRPAKTAFGYATVKPSKGDDVWGILWRVSARAMPMLDAFETKAYDRRITEVALPSGKREAAWVYYTDPGLTERPLDPGVLSMMLRAAYHQQLPDAYIENTFVPNLAAKGV
jgi:gamma-glutamylcyclotransferase (GGCT)/AIG2-like uncharacterized protein YtfP